MAIRVLAKYQSQKIRRGRNSVTKYTFVHYSIKSIMPLLRLLIYLCIPLLINLLGCSSNKTISSIRPADDCRNNNHIVVKSKNSQSDPNGDNIVIKGRNNLVEFDYDSSSYVGKNHHNTLVIEGNQNNVTLIQKKVHDSSQNSHDKIILKGDSEKLKDGLENTTVTSKNSNQIIFLSGSKGTVNAPDSLNSVDDTATIYIPEKKRKLNVRDAFNFYMSEAKQGNTAAIYKIGEFYQLGTGTSINATKAIEYYELAARKNNVDAQFMMGFIYQDGFKEIQPDKQKAIYYYTLAANNGNTDAYNQLNYLTQ
jgi:hypothetical protein